MLKISNFEVMGWEHAIRGMRNPMNSWEKSDSYILNCYGNCDECIDIDCQNQPDMNGGFVLGLNDLNLMKRLRNAGTDHRKFMRMIVVYLDITAPLYWWKEFDTYKVGTVANSCSTMHKIAEKEFTLEDFSYNHLIDYDLYSCNEVDEPVINEAPHISCGGIHLLNLTINEYQKAAYRTANQSLTDSQQLQNGLMGLNGESGECIDILKKYLFQGHDLDKAHIAKELGDVAWSLAVSAQALGFDLETILQMNVEKLKARYPHGFNAGHSQHRSSGDI